MTVDASRLYWDWLLCCYWFLLQGTVNCYLGLFCHGFIVYFSASTPLLGINPLFLYPSSFTAALSVVPGNIGTCIYPIVVQSHLLSFPLSLLLSLLQAHTMHPFVNWYLCRDQCLPIPVVWACALRFLICFVGLFWYRSSGCFLLICSVATSPCLIMRFSF